MEARYLVSVIIATYRRDSELKRALESLISQTYQQIEVIVVDDNANDEWNSKVAAIIKTLKEKANFPIVHIINSTNLGSARTRNKGIENSNGDYITFLDDDDCYLSKKIERQLSFLLKEEADFGITDLILYNEKEKVIDKRIRSYIKEYDTDKLLEYHLMYHMTGTDTLMFKASYLNSIGRFDNIDIGDEFYLMQKAILNKGKFCYLPECHVKAYVHKAGGGLSSGKMKIDGENDLYAHKKEYFEYLDLFAIRFVNMRHYAVLALAYLRTKEYFKCLINLIKSFCWFPKMFLKMILEMKAK